jgi:periplasmic protein TonB
VSAVLAVTFGSYFSLINMAHSVAYLMEKLFRPPNLDLGSSSQVRNVGLGISPPVAVHVPDPAYSVEAREAGYQGTVVLTVIVGTDGQVLNPRVVRALGKDLDEKAIDAVKRWRFKPATFCGTPTPVEINVEITFKLE